MKRYRLSQIFLSVLILQFLSVLICAKAEEQFTPLEISNTNQEKTKFLTGFIYSSKGKRDPFVPLVTSEGSYVVDLEEIGSVADIRLEGVVYDPQGHSVAIVNGIVIKEGDMIKGFELLKIEADRIVLSKDGELYMVRLQKEER